MKKILQILALQLTAVFLLSLNMHAQIMQNVIPLDKNGLNLTISESNTIINETQDGNATPPTTRFIIFRNMMDTSLFRQAYWENIKKTDYAADFSAIDFSDANLDGDKITNYEIAIFPLGLTSQGGIPLNASTPSKQHVVYKEIQKMLDAGKRVWVLSPFGLNYAFVSAPDADVKKFLDTYFGVKYVCTKAQAYTNGSQTTYTMFMIRGALGDPVSMSAQKYANGTYAQTLNPLVYVPACDLFASKDKSKYIEVEKFTQLIQNPLTDSIMGVRIENGNARGIFFSYSVEEICGESPRAFVVQRALDWLNPDAPPASVEVGWDNDGIDFGNVQLNQSKTKSAALVNTGSIQAKIKNIYLDWNEDKVYSIVQGNETKNFNIVPGDSHFVTVKFTPTKEKTYSAILIATYYDNSGDTSQLIYHLDGSGGSGDGPKVTTNFENNNCIFDSVKKGEKSIKTIMVNNTGTQDLEVSYMKLEETDSTIFTFDKGSGYPYTIPKGSTKQLVVRFVPKEAGKTYEGKIHITSNAINTDGKEFYINLTGYSKPDAPPESVPSEAISYTGLLKIKAAPNPLSDESTIYYSLGGGVQQRINIDLVDMNGRKVTAMLDENKAPGDYQLRFSTSSLPSGTYFIIARSGSEIAKLQVIVIK